MMSRNVHILMILMVLVCPALGGRCCDASGLHDAVDLAVSHCASGCCHDQPADDRQLPPARDCPHEFHDCFCEGALPVGPTAVDLLDSKPLASHILIATPAFASSQARDSLRVNSGPPPLGVSARLATLCTLLI